MAKAKSKIPVILGVLVLAAIVGAVLGFFLFQFISVSSKQTVEYNAKNEVSISRNTVIIPKKDDSNPLDLYTVLLHSDGGDNVTFAVNDSYGFSFADTGKEMSDGTYTVAISLSNGVTVEGPTLDYKADALAITELSLVPANKGQLDTGVMKATESSFDKKTMYKLYRQKIKSVQRKVGKGSVKSGDSGAHLSGLCYASLIDFAGDGIEELVLVYYDTNSSIPEGMSGASFATADTTKPGGLRHYHIGVYEFVEKTKKSKASLHCVFSGLDAARNLMGNDQLAYYAGYWYEGNGSFKLRVSEVDGQRYLLSGTGADGFKAFLMGYKANRFQAVTGMTNSGSTHSIDGMSQSQSDCDATQKLWTEKTKDYVFSASSTDALKSQGKVTLSTVKKTLKKLNAGIKGAKK